MSQACGGSDRPQRNRNNIPDLLRAMPVKNICKRPKGLQLNEDVKEVGETW